MAVQNQRGSKALRQGLIVIGIAAVVFGFWYYRDFFSLQNLAKHESTLRHYQQNRPWLVYGAAFAIYVLVTGFSIPGATLLSLTFAWFFGFWRAFFLVSFASTAGATVAFLTSRYLFRDFVQAKFGDRLQAINSSLKKEGAFYLFTMRLIPAIPFFVINVVMGLTPMKTTTYWWVSQLGMLPGTAVYIYAGSTFPDLNTLAENGGRGILTPQLVVAFLLLGLFPIVAKRILGLVRRPTES